MAVVRFAVVRLAAGFAPERVLVDLAGLLLAVLLKQRLREVVSWLCCF
ncbi:MAG: hypothetical protein R3C11_03420 [Planctomycetaceae bacterium]